jgi:hypothetical protein
MDFPFIIDSLSHVEIAFEAIKLFVTPETPEGISEMCVLL